MAAALARRRHGALASVAVGHQHALARACRGASFPALPLTLAPDFVQTVYLRAASQTTQETSLTLWQPQAYQVFLTLFVLEFVGAPTRHGWLVTLIKVLLGFFRSASFGLCWGRSGNACRSLFVPQSD